MTKIISYTFAASFFTPYSLAVHGTPEVWCVSVSEMGVCVCGRVGVGERGVGDEKDQTLGSPL